MAEYIFICYSHELTPPTPPYYFHVFLPAWDIDIIQITSYVECTDVTVIRTRKNSLSFRRITHNKGWLVSVGGHLFIGAFREKNYQKPLKLKERTF